MPRPERHGIRMGLLGAFVLTSWLTASASGLVTPVLAKTCGTITVENGTVSPGSGTTATTFTFKVRVSDKAGKEPSNVWVILNSASTGLTTSGTDFKGGVVYAGTRTLPAGTWPYRFMVRSSGGAFCGFSNVDPAAVVVRVPPTPKPTPVPTPKPTPVPTPKPTPVPTPKPTPVPTAKLTATPTAKPTTTSTSIPTGQPVSTGTPKPASTAGGATSSDPGASTRPTPIPTFTASPSPSSVAAGPLQGGSGGGGFGRGLTFDPTATFGVMTNPLLVWVVSTTGGVFMFLLLLRRTREDDDTWSNGLLLATASPGPVAEKGSEKASSAHEVAAATRSGEVSASQMISARRFDKPAADGVERARVAYHRVRISSKPDAVRSVERGRLDRGDEVEIVDSHEAFLQVRTPADITGWIPRHTIVGAPTD